MHIPCMSNHVWLKLSVFGSRRAGFSDNDVHTCHRSCHGAGACPQWAVSNDSHACSLNMPLALRVLISIWKNTRPDVQASARHFGGA